MAEIDELSIGIETTAKTAISTIDALNKKLDILVTSLGKINGCSITGLANGVNRLSTAMQGMKSVGTADFTRLSKNIENLSKIDTAGLNTAASSLSHISRTLSGFESASTASVQLGDMAKNIAKLGNKSVQTAITNIPLLATAMKDLMQTLSTAPRLSQNLIDMTNALANFTQQGSKVSVVSGTLVSGLNRTSGAMNSAKKSSMSLAAAFGKFYATYFLLIRGTKKLWGSIESSFDYLEVLNYFDAAFGQVAANADLSSFEEMGYESADAYYGSFAKRAEELTQKMSGFTIREGGLLESTGAVSLGLDPSQLMNYQAMFGQMSSSMGVTSETAAKLSQALTEIGADLASVKNLDFESVWNDMASGLAGMSRTLDKYGVNIRNVNLQQKLNELGINANIQALNQNDKALLRAIILLENTKYAWGDLADTINQPANQLRLIQANFENLSRTIGNLFLPVIKTVLPYVNALVIAVQRLFAWLGNLIGIDISDISTSIGGADMGDILDQTDDLTSGLGDAKKQADKLNKSLRQFDELKVISTKQDNGGGAGGGAGLQGGLLDEAFNKAFSDYQKVWDEAFGNLENRAQEIADKIEKAFEPIKKIIQDFVIGDFFQAGKDVSALVVSITDFFAQAIDNVDWNKIGKNIGDFFAGIDWFAILKSVGNLIWQALKAAFELYVGAFSSAPLETALISLVAFPKLLKAITASKFITGIGKLWKNFKIWGEKIKLVTETLTGNKDSVSDLVTAYPKLSKKVDSVKTAFSNFFSSVKTNGFWKTVDGGITNIRNNLGGLQKAAIVAVAGFAEFSVVSDSMEKLTLGTENWLAEIGKIAGVVAAAGAAMYVALGPAGLVMAAVTGLTAGIIGVETAMQQINAETIGNTIRNALENPGGVSMDEIAGAFNEKMSSIASSFDNVSQHSQALETAQTNIKNTYGEISAIESAMSQGAISVEDGVKRINEAFAGLSTDFNDAITALKQGIIGALGEGSILRQYLAAMGYDVEALNGIVVGDVANIQKEFDKLTAEYESIKESTNPEDIARKEEIIRAMTAISGVFDETSQNMTAFKTSVENMRLNFGSMIDTDDVNNIYFESEKFGNSLQSMAESYNNASSSIEQGNETFQNNLATLNNMLKAAGIEENTATYSEIMSKIPDITTSADADLKEAFNGIIETIQQDALNQIPTLIEQAGKEWETLDFKTKSELNYQGIANKDAYIEYALKDYKNTVLSPMEEQINNALKSLNIDEEGIMVQKAEELYKSLFTWDYDWDFGGGERTRKLAGDWKQILQEANLRGVSKEEGEAIGDNLISGYISKLEDGSAKKALAEAAATFAYVGVDSMKIALGIRSPSRVTKELGKNTVDGYNLGITQNDSSSKTAVSSWMSNITGVFSEWISKSKENFGIWGKDTLQGFTVWSSDTVQKFSEWGTYSKEKISNFSQESKRSIDIWRTETSSKIESWKNINFGKINTWSENTKGTIRNWKTNTQNTFENWKNDTFGSVGRWSADIEGKFTQWKTNTENTTSSWYGNMQSYFTESKWNFGGVSQGLGKAFSSAFESVKGIWNSFASSLNQKLTWTIDPIVTAGKKIFEGTTINLGNIPKFAKGGITLSHTFAEIGEYNRPEAILPLTNDRAMGMIAESIYENYNGGVAESGLSPDVIERAVYTATYNAVSAAIGNSAMLRDIRNSVEEGKTITIGQDEVGRASVRYIQGEERRLQKSLVGLY